MVEPSSTSISIRPARSLAASRVPSGEKATAQSCAGKVTIGDAQPIEITMQGEYLPPVPTP